MHVWHACVTTFQRLTKRIDLPILGDTDLHFTVDGHEFEANVSVSPAIDDFLLGREWLVKNKAKWDFAASTISFGDRVVHAYWRTLGRVCRRVTVSENCVIPAQQEANIPVGIPHPSSDWAIEPRQLKSRVMMAQTLLSDGHNQLVARVCNYWDESYQLKANSFLGRLLNLNLACSDHADASVLPDVSLSEDRQPTLEQDPTTVFCTSTISAVLMADTARMDSSLAMESLHSHIQCLLDGLLNELTAFIITFVSVFACI